jgi:hypothetical protein
MVPSGTGLTKQSNPNVVIPRGTKLLSIAFRLTTGSPTCNQSPATCVARSKTLNYRHFRLTPYSIPSGTTTVIKLAGIDIEPIQIGINTGGSLIRRGISHFGFGAIDKILNAKRNVIDEFNASVSSLPSQAFDPQLFYRNLVSLNTVWQFDSPVPPNSGFIANLTFHYNPSDFPDDPNFREDSLQVVAFDPASGRIERHPTTLDLSARTATARVNGLAPFYTLGVFGPFTSHTLKLPLLSTEEGLENKLVLVNPGSGSLTLSAHGYDGSGVPLAGPGVDPATALILPAGQQLARSAAEFFHLDPLALGALGLNGWIQARADSPFIAAYQMLGSGNKRDVLDVSSFSAAALALSDVAYDSSNTTEIHLANGANIDNDMLLELYSANGSIVSASDVSLPAKGRFAGRIQDLFPTIPKPFTGYLLAIGNTDLSAASLSVSSSEISALIGQPLQSGLMPTKLYGAYVLTSANNLTTRLNLVNPTTNLADSQPAARRGSRGRSGAAD